jgi:hypothetical protein
MSVTQELQSGYTIDVDIIGDFKEFNLKGASASTLAGSNANVVFNIPEKLKILSNKYISIVIKHDNTFLIKIFKLLEAGDYGYINFNIRTKQIEFY